MARTPAPPEDDFTERIVDIDVSSEMQTSFLEYAYSVIYSRALPDARDGLKPVQRRILYTMDEMGVRPDRGHVKCARVVGQVMGIYHPHGDGAIYDAMVRMAQPWSMRLPMVDGHGNFGSLDDGPAAMRYTECRMAPAALTMTDGLDEDAVDFKPNYDGKDTEPVVLPAAFPNLLVNGATGIAVGMATNCPPHNLVEVVQALRHLIKHPDADVDELMRFIPGPDLPGGGKIIGLDGIREAYQTGQGLVPDPGHRPGGAGAPAAQGHRGHRAALPGRPRAGHRADQEPGQRAQADRRRRPQGPVRPDQRPPAGDRGQERLQPGRAAGAAVPADQARGQLRHQRRRPGRGPAADADAARRAHHLPRAPLRGHPAADRVRAEPGRGAAAPGRGAAGRPARHRRRDRDHPQQ